MRRIVGIICFAVLCCAASRTAANAAEDSVRAQLSQRGLQPGFDGREGEIIALGKAMVKIGDAASCPRLAALRDRCHKVASLEARGKILQVLAQSLTADRTAGFHHDGIAADLDLAALSRVFSERVLTGWRIIASAETCSNGLYTVAVAVFWSRESEKTMDAAKAGRLALSGKWKDELTAYIKGRDLSTWADVRVFVDSNGFPHVLGVGLSDWDGDPRTQEVAMRKADMFARKNLMLGLYGDAAVMEAAGKWRKEVFSGSDKDVSQQEFYESLSEIRVRDPLPEGCGPFHVASIKNPVNGRKEFVSIYSFEPPAAIGSSGRFPGKKVESAANGVSISGIMIFNPGTGKFEKR